MTELDRDDLRILRYVFSSEGERSSFSDIGSYTGWDEDRVMYRANRLLKSGLLDGVQAGIGEPAVELTEKGRMALRDSEPGAADSDVVPLEREHAGSTSREIEELRRDVREIKRALRLVERALREEHGKSLEDYSGERRP